MHVTGLTTPFVYRNKFANDLQLLKMDDVISNR